MSNWLLKDVNTLEDVQESVNITSPTQVKVKVSHLMITDYDAMLYSGKIKTDYPIIPGRAAVGIVTEVGENCYGMEKGMRVYFKPTRACGSCLSCLGGKKRDCTTLKLAGRDFNGFLRDFVVCDQSEIAPLPQSVDEFRALCIETIGIAENIYNKLNLSAGQRVAVIGAGFEGNVIAQVLLYHKIIPIVIDSDISKLERARRCGIYFTYEADDKLKDCIVNTTSGDMCDAVVYCANSNLPINTAINIAGYGKKVVLCGQTGFGSTLDAGKLFDKNLTVFGISNAFTYTDTVINMLVNNAVNLDFFERETLTSFDPAALLEERANDIAQSKESTMKILKMVL
ncbi:MAG: alcohol dehydrogenase catalytic domain-containing protein [Clostridiales bacterium]|nr:alcohol dehydrogenase catalytic domain-containing protein [Clostridiales bacterium]